MRRCYMAFVFATVIGATFARADSSPQQPWQFETITLKNGQVLKGLIEESSNQSIKFRCVLRQTGRPTITYHTVVQRTEIKRIDRLARAEREALQARLLELEQNTPQAEKERMEGLDVKEVPWGGQAKGGWRYSSDYFTLHSNAPEEIVRRVALRVEQIYAAYALYLPPRHKGGTPTSVTLFTDVAEYQKLLAAQKQQFLNLAFFDPSANRIVCYSDVQQLGERLALVRTQHRQIRSELEAKRAEFARLYKGKELARVTQAITDSLQQMDRADQQNTDLFNKATLQLFATLYHESFHAYLAGFVYPPSQGELPRWLNEGLAQIFETAILDGKELLIGHADPLRLTRAKEMAGKGELVSVGDLLKSGSKQFLLAHVVDRQSSDRHYLTSWALAFYLTFERRLFGSAPMDRFVKQFGEGADPKASFEELLGMPLAKFEPEFRKYVQLLQADGTVLKTTR
jgi:Protein of unknown function (DUF1570)